VRDSNAAALNLKQEKELLAAENSELKELMDAANSCIETLRNVQECI
jgi:prefoldin subunit 5